MSTPLVSILIPAYNAAPWIRQSVESALAQTWPNIEVVVVDDESEDGTAEIVEQVARPNVRVVRQAHAGSSAANNRAFRDSRGEFIQRLDADDLLAPDKISIQMSRLTRDPRAVAVGEWARFTGDPKLARFVSTVESSEQSTVEWLSREFAGGLPMLGSARWLAHRSIVEAGGEWNEQLTLNNDFDYVVRMVLAAERVIGTPDARYYYRSGNPNSLASQRTPQAWRSSLTSIELGTHALLERESTPRTRSACADVFQQLAYTAYLESPAVFVNATESVRWLGGSSVEMTGGMLFSVLRSALGWQKAKLVKSLAYRAGYGRVARVKQAALGRGGAR